MVIDAKKFKIKKKNLSPEIKQFIESLPETIGPFSSSVISVKKYASDICKITYTSEVFPKCQMIIENDDFETCFVFYEYSEDEECETSFSCEEVFNCPMGAVPTTEQIYEKYNKIVSFFNEDLLER